MGTMDQSLKPDLLVIGFGKGGKTVAATMGRPGKRVVLVEQSERTACTPPSEERSRSMSTCAPAGRTSSPSATSTAVRSSLGATLLSVDARELINTVTLAKRHGIKAAELRDAVYTHPTSTEAFNDVLATIVRAGT